MPTSSARPFDAVVLAGAASRRLDGADKALVEVDGLSLLDRVLAAVAGASRVIVVGPRRPVRVASVLWCEESPPGGGPVAAFAAGLGATTADTVLLLAVDLPFVAGAVAPLLAAVRDGADLAALVDADGRTNFLAAAWRRPSALGALQRVGRPGGQSMRRLLAGLTIAGVADEGGWGLDCDTWRAVEQARVVAIGSKESHDGQQP